MRGAGFAGVLLVVVTLALVMLLAGGIGLCLPLHKGPDEPAVVHYANFLRKEHRLPDPLEDDVFQAQHPPLYHALLAGVIEALPDFGEGAGPPAPPRFYESDLRLSWDLEHVSARAATGAPAGPEATRVRFPYLLRLSGLALACLTALLVFSGARRALPAYPRGAVLAAAAVLVVPGLAAVFATPSNDQTTILLATAALGVLVGDASRRRNLVVASLLFGLGFLSKLLMIGPFVCGLALAAGWGRPRVGEAMKRLLILGAGPVLIAGWWMVRQVMLTGSLNALQVAADRHPGILRMNPPDWWEGLHLIGGYLPTALGAVGSEGIGPGGAWSPFALALPCLVIVLAGVLSRSRTADRHQRLLARAFILGLLIQVAALVYGNINFLYIHGRYLQVFILPAAWVLCAGSRHVLGTRAGSVVGTLAVVCAVGGPLLLHARLLPRYHGGALPADEPGVVVSLDLGGVVPTGLVQSGMPRVELAEHLLDADRRMIVGPSGEGQALKVAVGDLDPDALHVASIRLHPFSRSVGVPLLGHVRFQVGEVALSGLLSAHGRRGRWVHLALPPSAANGVLEARGRGRALAWSQLVIRRLPLAFKRAQVTDDTVSVPYEAGAWDSALSLRCRLEDDEGGRAPFQDIQLPSRADGQLTFSRGDLAGDSLRLRLESSETILADIKAAILVPGAEEPESTPENMRRIQSSPGLLVPLFSPASHGGSVILTIPGEDLPRQAVTLYFLAADAGVIPDGQLAVRRGEETTEVRGGKLTLGEVRGAGTREALEVVFTGNQPLALDRLLAVGRIAWTRPLPVR